METFAGRRKLITISIPVLNEAGNLPALVARLRKVADENTSEDFEFLFTDNASSDATFELLAAEAAKDHRIRIIRFSRNFGFQRSILTNYINARGDAAVQIDADLQDPPELITEFIAHWKRGYKVVYGIRRRRQEGWLLERARKSFYRGLASLSEVEIPVDAGDFRLIDRVILDHLKTIKDHNPYIRGIIASLGYPQVGVSYDRAARQAGSTKFNLFKLIKLGIDGVTSQSTVPLHYITLFGLVLCLATIVMSFAYVVMSLLGYIRTAGFVTLALLTLFSIGMNAAFLGIIGEYIARIFDNVRGHPFTISERVIEGGKEVSLINEIESTASGHEEVRR